MNEGELRRPEGAEPGDTAPDFTLPSSAGVTITLSHYREKSSVLLIFYPGDFTPVCTKQLCSYTAAYEEFMHHGYTLLGIGSDSVEKHREFTKSKNIVFPLLSDLKGEVCQAYGVWGNIIRRPKRAIVMVGKDGKITYKHVEATRLLYKKADAVLDVLERAAQGKPV